MNSLIRIPPDLPRFCGFKRGSCGPIIQLSPKALHARVQPISSRIQAVAKATVTSELFKLSLDLGRTTWFGNLAFGLLVVLILWRENQLPPASIWWSVLAAIVVTRAWYCQRMSAWMSAHSNRLPSSAQAYAALAALEGTAWALALVLLPASHESAAVLQLVLTIAVLLGTLLPFAPAGMPWIAFAVPLGFAQLIFMLSRDLPLREITLVMWAMTLIGAAVAFHLLRRALSNNVAMRTRAHSSARAQEQANAELNRSREQLRMALDAIDAGVADTNVLTGERSFSARYIQILGYTDRESFLQSYKFTESLHPDDRDRVRVARRRHIDHGAALREECRMQKADGSYVWVVLRGESVRGSSGRTTRLVFSIVDDTERREAQQRMAESERRYRALVEASPSLIWICDRYARLTFVSDRACRDVFGYEPREMIGRYVWDFNAPEFTRREFLRRFSPVMHGRPVFDMEAIQRTKRAEPLYVNISALPMLNDAGEIESVTGICSDITGLKQRERELNIALRNQQAVFDAAGEGIAFVRRGRIEGPNGALARMLGVSREELIGLPAADILANRGDWETIEHGTSAAGIKGDAAIHEVMLRARDGRTIWCQLTSRQAGEANSRILVLTDISALKKREELAWHHANHDELTGLPNRRLLVEHARRLLSVALRQRRLAAVLVLDLDGFKEFNDLFGHAYGDALLRRVAQRLSNVLRDYDVVARTGGDEFVVLLPEIDEPSVAAVVAEKLIAAASENVEVPGRVVRMHASVGIALFPADGHDFDSLLSSADNAMYAAKAAGKNGYQFASEVGTTATKGAASKDSVRLQ
ncbi:MAG TPA: diguanylate cyclase [Burkholderiaceae bacterium]|nr:diguanylate cyclase [Burkholderiaceae bacterium]